jgi:cyclophilin family peptidyl-prolyl cis-trans isomerase
MSKVGLLFQRCVSIVHSPKGEREAITSQARKEMEKGHKKKVIFVAANQTPGSDKSRFFFCFSGTIRLV